MSADEHSMSGLLGQSLAALEAGDQESARIFLAQAEELGGDTLSSANLALLGAFIEQDSGEFDTALPKFEHAASLAFRNLDSLEGVSLYLNATTAMGSIHRSHGRYSVAEELLTAALHRTEHRAAPEDIVAVYNELGVLFKYSGKFDLSAEFYERALERLGGTSSVDLATVYHNIAGLAHARGDYAAAEEPARKSVAIRTEILGADHPDVAADCAALAPILVELGKLHEAESLIRRALTVFEEFYGVDHYEVGIVTGNLAAVVHERGRADEARAYYEQALKTLENACGRQHPEIAPVLSNLAQLIRDAEPETARELLERARASLVSASVEADHPTLVAVVAGLEELKRG